MGRDWGECSVAPVVLVLWVANSGQWLVADVVRKELWCEIESEKIPIAVKSWPEIEREDSHLERKWT
jgi:hypothetical protein